MKFSALSICIGFLVLMATGSWSSVIIEPMTVQTLGQKVIEQVETEERTAFILYQLAQALNSNGSQAGDKPTQRFNVVSLYSKEAEEFKFIHTYDSFAVDLLNWVKQKYGANDQDVYRMVLSRPVGLEAILCTSNGVCYSGDSIGCFCCPF